MTKLPISEPQKIICIGLNFHSHAEEAGQKIPKRPIVFAKWANSLIGPGEPIELFPVTEKVDYEAELGVVIGKKARDLRVEDALDCVGGYINANDVSARDLQFLDRQFTRSKSIDSFCPVGPQLVPASEIEDPQNLRIQTRVNGELVQDSNTSDMVFTVAEVLAFISQGLTLEPGDLILTGTPGGVGFLKDPPVFLADGDEVSVEVEGLGVLTNPVREARS
jgi:2-keto-4-pentenoate hydratase/2-oxohepta-3-ene-1,7-dioic acid hydratase in catechol pathway